MAYNLYFKLFLFVVFFLSTLWVFRIYINGPNREVSGRGAALIIIAILLLLWVVRIPFLRDREYDIDTSTWLSAVIAINHYPDKLWTLLNYTDARPLTVFPLLAGSWAGMPVNYGSAEIIGLLLWTGTVLLLYQICKLFAGRSLSLVLTWSLALFLGTICHIFAAYNSEHNSIFMVTAGVALFFLYVYRRWTSPVVASVTGLLLGSLVYAKFQNAPMGLLTGAFLLLAMAQRKDWRNMMALIVGCLFPTILVNVFYGMRGNWMFSGTTISGTTSIIPSRPSFPPCPWPSDSARDALSGSFSTPQAPVFTCLRWPHWLLHCQFCLSKNGVPTSKPTGYRSFLPFCFCC
jgi:hypothetical protein